jgi:hypothetical protein
MTELCTRFEQWLLISPEQLQAPLELARHLQSCQRCQRSQQRFGEIEQLFASEPPPAAPDGLVAATMRRIERDRRAPVARPGLRAAAALAAVVLIGCSIGWGGVLLRPYLPGIELGVEDLQRVRAAPDLDPGALVGPSAMSGWASDADSFAGWAREWIPSPRLEGALLRSILPLLLLLALLWLASNVYLVRRSYTANAAYRGNRSEWKTLR